MSIFESQTSFVSPKFLRPVGALLALPGFSKGSLALTRGYIPPLLPEREMGGGIASGGVLENQWFRRNPVPLRPGDELDTRWILNGHF